MSPSRSDPASSTGTSDAKMNGRSYEITWFTARIADSSAYLLLEPQPAMNRPTISMAETARKNRMPMFRSATPRPGANGMRSEEHTSELQSQSNLVCRLLLEKKKKNKKYLITT